MEARKLPSGSWRCQVFSHYEETRQPDGTIKKRRVYKSFTSNDKSNKGKRKAEAMAAAYAANKEALSPVSESTFGDALTQYIAEREAILSPSSIRKYKSMQRNSLKGLETVSLSRINKDVIQEYVNNASMHLSSKSVRDMNGLITAVINRFCPEVVIRTSLPKKVRTQIFIPTEEEIKALIRAAEGQKIEIPILLAAFGSLRRGEAAAITRNDIQGSVLHVTKTMVMNDQGKWITKAPKSFAGDRYVTLPDFVAEKVKQLPDEGVGLNPNKITAKFSEVLKLADLPHFRFHDLRHYNASIQHALGVPDAYIMQMGGWENDSVLKEIYRHAIPDMQKRFQSSVLEYFNTMQHDLQHGNS